MTASTSEDRDVNPLTSWYKQYLETNVEDISVHSPVIQAVQSDELDYDQIEVEVQRLVANADVLRGFCGKCRWMLDHWPHISEKAVEKDEMYKIFPLGSAIHTRYIEASARAGCRFCTFLFSNLRTNSELDTLRKIERRLNLLGTDDTTTLSIYIGSGFTDSSHMLWLNYPQKMALAFDHEGAQTCRTTSENVLPTCE